MKLRIAVWHNLPSGGGKRALFDHVKGLLERGHHVESWRPQTADASYLPLTELCPEHVVPLSPVTPWPWFRRGRALVGDHIMRARIAAMDRHCQECASQINRGGFDVLFANACVFFRVTSIAKHVHIPSAIYLGEPYRWLYEALPRLPWAALPRQRGGLLSPRRWRERVSDSIHVRALRLQTRQELENASAFDSILVNSLYSRESILRAYGLESTVCYLGIDHTKFKPTGERVESFAMGLGGLSFEKGPDRAIRALGCVNSSKRPELIWVGNFTNADYQRELHELAAHCGVRLTVKVRVSDAELVSLLSRAAMLLYTSRLEPFGLAPLEANACGAPVVGVAEGGVRESVIHRRNGLLVAGDDSRELGRAIECLIDDPPFAQKLRETSVDHVRSNWSLERAIDSLENALIKLKSVRRRLDARTLVPETSRLTSSLPEVKLSATSSLC
jgi:glycosyltransferase involved in cell wall biosynthesis